MFALYGNAIKFNPSIWMKRSKSITDIHIDSWWQLLSTVTVYRREWMREESNTIVQWIDRVDCEYLLFDWMEGALLPTIEQKCSPALFMYIYMNFYHSVSCISDAAAAGHWCVWLTRCVTLRQYGSTIFKCITRPSWVAVVKWCLQMIQATNNIKWFMMNVGVFSRDRERQREGERVKKWINWIVDS